MSLCQSRSVLQGVNNHSSLSTKLTFPLQVTPRGRLFGGFLLSFVTLTLVWRYVMGKSIGQIRRNRRRLAAYLIRRGLQGEEILLDIQSLVEDHCNDTGELFIVVVSETTGSTVVIVNNEEDICNGVDESGTEICPRFGGLTSWCYGHNNTGLTRKIPILFDYYPLEKYINMPMTMERNRTRKWYFQNNKFCYVKIFPPKYKQIDVN